METRTKLTEQTGTGRPGARASLIAHHIDGDAAIETEIHTSDRKGDLPFGEKKRGQPFNIAFLNIASTFLRKARSVARIFGLRPPGGKRPRGSPCSTAP
jgi:hypothetical protein